MVKRMLTANLEEATTEEVGVPAAPPSFTFARSADEYAAGSLGAWAVAR